MFYSCFVSVLLAAVLTPLFLSVSPAYNICLAPRCTNMSTKHRHHVIRTFRCRKRPFFVGLQGPSRIATSSDPRACEACKGQRHFTSANILKVQHLALQHFFLLWSTAQNYTARHICLGDKLAISFLRLLELVRPSSFASAFLFSARHLRKRSLPDSPPCSTHSRLSRHRGSSSGRGHTPPSTLPL